jgi:hypothetical protein
MLTRYTEYQQREKRVDPSVTKPTELDEEDMTHWKLIADADLNIKSECLSSLK